MEKETEQELIGFTKFYNCFYEQSVIVEPWEVAIMLEAEMEDADPELSVELSPVYMTEEEYNALPEFQGW